MLPTIEAPAAEASSCDPADLFAGPPSEIWLEIGFGGGEHLIEQARRRPDVGFVGVEPFAEGVAKALAGVKAHKLENVRLRRDDARAVMEGFTDASLDRVYILFPDPWHKLRHHKRRLIQSEFLRDLARVLKSGGLVRFATDWADYADWTLERFNKVPEFAWTAQCADDWRLAPKDHVETRYQKKQLGDCSPIFLEFVCV
ncbi:MAG: tRNA (guanosine(46)-N7)-methyltransferase TrmB [Pseudomonadota bacterium]